MLYRKPHCLRLHIGIKRVNHDRNVLHSFPSVIEMDTSGTLTQHSTLPAYMRTQFIWGGTVCLLLTVVLIENVFLLSRCGRGESDFEMKTQSSVQSILYSGYTK